MYHEKQVKNRCRFHSVNNAAGGKIKFDELRMIEAYENTYNVPGLVKAGFSCIPCTQETFSMFILRKTGIAASFLFHSHENFIEKNVSRILLFDNDHIFAARKINDEWFNFDSRLAKPTKCPLSNLIRSKKIIVLIESHNLFKTMLPELLKRINSFPEKCNLLLVFFYFNRLHPKRKQFEFLISEFTKKNKHETRLSILKLFLVFF